MTTTPQTFQAQWPLAVQALGVHAQMHALPSPASLDVRVPDIFVHLRRGAHESWIASVVVEQQRTEERHPGGVPAMRTEWDVRLPDTGFRFTLVAYLPIPAWQPAVVTA